MKIRPKDDCRWDLVALGEVMLRLDPSDRRVSSARTFDVHQGGGEYNVARELKRCLGMDTAVVTAPADEDCAAPDSNDSYWGSEPGQ